MELEQTLWGCAELAQKLGRDELAAQILATCEAMWVEAGVERPAGNRGPAENHSQTLRESMGEKRFTAAWEVQHGHTPVELIEQLSLPGSDARAAV